MQYEIPIGSGFSLVVSAERLDAWCAGLRQSGKPRYCAWSAVHITNADATNHPGVSWSKKNNSWRTRIVIAGKWKHLGYFKDKDLAIRARRLAEIDHVNTRQALP